ncbi:MAG: DegT/DnrJ/EryC1/StrS family aminotransferase [Verrucomicrobiota bacterium]
MSSPLAILGGSPVRTKPFFSRPCVDETDKAAVMQTMKDDCYSRFVGSNLPGTREHLESSSASLAELDAPYTFFGGQQVRNFERDWAKLHEVPYAVAMNSATSALTAGLMAADVGPGDEVITTPLSFTATASAIVAAQAIPVFADIDAETLCLDLESVKSRVSAKTKAIVFVHWCGNAGEFDELVEWAQKQGLILMEDAAQAPATVYKGKPLGSWGNAGVFSFSEPKNVMTGEGGMLITHDSKLAAKCRMIRNHGEVIPEMSDDDDFTVNLVGYNFRMVEMVAALGCAQTAKLERLNAIRNENALYLREGLSEVLVDYLKPQRLTHSESFAAYTAAFRWTGAAHGVSRNAVAQALRKEGIPVATGVGRLMSDHPMFQKKLAYGLNHFPFSCHLHGDMESLDYSASSLPVAHQVHDEEYLGFFLMGWPNGKDDMDDIIGAFRKIEVGLDDLKKLEEQEPVREVAFDRGRGK